MVQEEGVNVIANAKVENVEKVEDQLILSLHNGRKVIMIQTYYLMCDTCMTFLQLLGCNLYTGLEKLCRVILAVLEVHLPHQI